jgi:glycosyltransferase involved in cell wall biosynthesis
VIAFVIPAHNEEQLIAGTIESIHESARSLGRPYEIIVSDDASTDRTAEIAAAHAARVIPINRRQISAARNAGAREALRNGDVKWLVFLDADTKLPRATLREAMNALEGGAAGGGSSVEFDGPIPRWAEIMLAIFLAVFRLFKWTGGCFVFCRRDAFEKTGGWDESLFAGEELYMAQALKRAGRFVVLRESVITSGRKLRAHSAREILTSLARIGFSGRRAVRDRKALGLWYGERSRAT